MPRIIGLIINHRRFMGDGINAATRDFTGARSTSTSATSSRSQ